MRIRPARETTGPSPASVEAFWEHMRHLMTSRPLVRIPEKSIEFIPTLDF